jgi:hypothetical protein
MHDLTAVEGFSEPVNVDRDVRTSAHFSKFGLHRSTSVYELRKVMGTSKLIDPSAAFHLKFLNQIRRLLRRNFK